MRVFNETQKFNQWCIKQKANLLKNTDQQFNDKLNNFAREGWRVISTNHMPESYALKVVLERDKNR